VRRGQDLGSHICQRRCDDATWPRKRRPSQRRFERSGREATREQDGGAHAERAREDARLPQASDQRCGGIGANAGAPQSAWCFGNSPASLRLKSQQNEACLCCWLSTNGIIMSQSQFVMCWIYPVLCLFVFLFVHLAYEEGNAECNALIRALPIYHTK